MAGTVTTTVTQINYSQTGTPKFCKKVSVAWTADASDGSLPATSITDMNGWLVKVVTNPGSVAPTDNYDIALYDADDGALDALAGLLANRDTANGEQVYPLISGAATPLFLAGTYSLAITGNSVNSATGLVVFYLVDSI
jgi:hypothetical protein